MSSKPEKLVLIGCLFQAIHLFHVSTRLRKPKKYKLKLPLLDKKTLIYGITNHKNMICEFCFSLTVKYQSDAKTKISTKISNSVHFSVKIMLKNETASTKVAISIPWKKI